VLPTIRTAADGGTVGQSGAKEETIRHIPEGSYSLGLVIGYQKDSAQEVLAGVRLGQQQRFGWCTVIDPSLPLKPPEHPGYLVSNIEDGAGLRSGTITYCQEINDELWRQNHAKVSGRWKTTTTTKTWTPINPRTPRLEGCVTKLTPDDVLDRLVNRKEQAA
jgi:hypothetical protein